MVQRSIHEVQDHHKSHPAAGGSVIAPAFQMNPIRSWETTQNHDFPGRAPAFARLSRYLLICLLLGSCTGKADNSTENIVAEFYQVFNDRNDIERFLAFYDERIILEDIVNGDRIEGKSALREFFDWGNPDFESLSNNSLVVNEVIVDKNKAVVTGYFTAFKWGAATFEAMHFTSLFTLSNTGKIIRQVDWINYPASLVDYENRKNSNDWLRE